MECKLYDDDDSRRKPVAEGLRICECVPCVKPLLTFAGDIIGGSFCGECEPNGYACRCLCLGCFRQENVDAECSPTQPFVPTCETRCLDALRSLTERWERSHGSDCAAEPTDPSLAGIFPVPQESLAGKRPPADAMPPLLSFNAMECKLYDDDDSRRKPVAQGRRICECAPCVKPLLTFAGDVIDGSFCSECEPNGYACRCHCLGCFRQESGDPECSPTQPFVPTCETRRLDALRSLTERWERSHGSDCAAEPTDFSLAGTSPVPQEKLARKRPPGDAVRSPSDTGKRFRGSVQHIQYTETMY